MTYIESTFFFMYDTFIYKDNENETLQVPVYITELVSLLVLASFAYLLLLRRCLASV